MKKMKRWGKILLCVMLALVLLVGAYVAYVLIDYHRIGDLELQVQEGDESLSAVDTDKSYTVLSYNIHHIYCDNNRNSKLGKLGRKVQISLKICTVHNV